MSPARRLLTVYYRPKPGGLCRRLFRGLGALAERGYEVHYLAAEEFPLRAEGIRFHRLRVPTRRRDGCLFWFWFTLLAPVALAWIGGRHRVDRLFAFGSYYGALLQPLRLLRRLPLTVLLRADVLANHRLAGRSPWTIALERRVEGLGLGGARVLAVSRTLASRVEERHPGLLPHRVGVLPNDVPAVAEIVPGAAPGAPLRAAFVGVLEARKNVGVLLSALAAVEPGRIGLTLYGAGPAEAELRRRAREAGVASRVDFAGWRPSAELWREIDVLLMPSLHEGSPNAVLEAIGHGVPVLASDLPEHREILPAADLLPATEAGAWAAALRRLAAEPDLLAARSAEQATFARPLRFDWDELFAAAVGAGPEESLRPPSDRGT